MVRIKNPNRFGLGFAFLIGECPPPFSESVVTPFLAGDLAYQEVPESQLRDSTGLHTGFAFKPPCSGWAPKRII
jgi:hypothetical protein